MPEQVTVEAKLNTTDLMYSLVVRSHANLQSKPLPTLRTLMEGVLVHNLIMLNQTSPPCVGLLLGIRESLVLKPFPHTFHTNLLSPTLSHPDHLHCLPPHMATHGHPPCPSAPPPPSPPPSLCGNIHILRLPWCDLPFSGTAPQSPCRCQSSPHRACHTRPAAPLPTGCSPSTCRKLESYKILVLVLQLLPNRSRIPVTKTVSFEPVLLTSVPETYGFQLVFLRTSPGCDNCPLLLQQR